MKQAYPVFIGVGAGAGMVLALAIWGAEAITWGLIFGGALGAIIGVLPRK